MVVPCAIIAANTAKAAGSAGVTAMGLGMGKTDLDLTRNLFKMQMRQAKRLWTADWAEASVRHGEQCMQSAQQHAEAQAMATAAYFQAEKIASQGIKLARDQDSRAYEMSWRSEVRESLRDELTNQNNRFNIVMLCDTVCLGCVFSLVADGTPPAEASMILVNIYVFMVGFSVSLFSISLWCAVIVVRRLHEHTASNLERKLFTQSEGLQKVWKQQVHQNLPTGPREIHLMNQAFEKWVAEFLKPLGDFSVSLLSIGVVSMFVSAGLLTHAKYLAEFQSLTAAIIFWSFVMITSVAVLLMKFSEDRAEKRKEGVYDVSWQDESSDEKGPFAKIIRMADELFSNEAMDLASTDRMESFGKRERIERDSCASTKSLHQRVESLRKESDQRAKTRKDVLQLLTTAAEELDALPEELTSSLNKMLHNIDEADSRTASLITVQAEGMLDVEGSSRKFNGLRKSPRRRAAMATHPIDAQRIPVSLGSLRKKLGEVSLTTMLRLRNMSDQPLRLKSGVQLKDGKYVKSLNASDPRNNAVCYHLYPGTEIPPRTEVVIATRSKGVWVPTSGIEGELVYTNRDESWLFRIRFSNKLLSSVRHCKVQASHMRGTGVSVDGVPEYWQISKNEVDRKANNEVVISMDVLQGDEARKAETDYRRSLVPIKGGFLLKNRAFGLQWQLLWFELTATDILFGNAAGSARKSKIALKDITSVREGSDYAKQNVFEIHTGVEGSRPYKLSASSPVERDDWVKNISRAIGMDVYVPDLGAKISTEDSANSIVEDGFECVQDDRGITVTSI